MSCPTCGGELVVLGTLGLRTHYRCQNCGAQFSKKEGEEDGRDR